jgi:hypothetical protein
LGQEDTTGVALPGEFSGTAALALRTELQSGEVNCLINIFSKPVMRFHLLAGYRYFQLEERLDFFTESTLLPPSAPDIFNTEDHFLCTNTFHGGQIGARFEIIASTLSFTATGRAAYGRMERETAITGQLTTDNFSEGGEVQTFPGGYFALPTNIGFYRDTRFAVVSEVNAQVGWKVYPWARVFVGYSLLNATHVSRPGDQIDRVINVSQAPAISGNPDNTLQGPPAPVFGFRDSTWWAQGVSAGVELRF